MSTTTTEKPTTETTSRSPRTATPKRTGVLAIVWEPDKDKTAPPNRLHGAETTRTFQYVFEDIAATKAAEKAAKATGVQYFQPKFSVLKTTENTFLVPGLNWVDAELWYAAKAHSAARTDFEDRIGMHLASGALVEFEPKEQGILKGTLDDYPIDVAIALAEHVHSAQLLRKYQNTTIEPELHTALDRRIKDIEQHSAFGVR